MSKAVQFNEYGGIDVLYVADLEPPVAEAGEVLVQVKAAGVNPGEQAVREGVFHERWPATFPSGQGTDFAGVVAAIGDDVSDVAVGDEVIGWSDDRASQAEHVVVAAGQVVPKPQALAWEVAGGLPIVGFTAYAAVRAVGAKAGDTVVISGAAGGVGTVAVQLAVRTGATVIGLASESNHAWLTAHGATPLAYGDGLEERLLEVTGGRIDAFIDLFGGGYVDLALKLGVAKDRIDTIIDFAAVEAHGVKGEGQAFAQEPAVLTELAELIAGGDLELPLAKTYPLADVQDAYRDLSARHTHGKIVLIP